MTLTSQHLYHPQAYLYDSNGFFQSLSSIANTVIAFCITALALALSYTLQIEKFIY